MAQFRIACGDESGLLKVIDVSKKGNTIKVIGKQAEAQMGISHATWCGSEEKPESEILYANRQGMIMQYHCIKNESVRNYSHVMQSGGYSPAMVVKATGAGIIKGLEIMDGTKIVTVTELGSVQVATLQPKSTVLREFSVGNTRCMKIHSNSKRMLNGGLENDVKMWDIESAKECFRAKNVLPDKLGLCPKICVTSISYLTETTFATGSNYHDIRLYDTRQRRPTMRVTPFDCAITSLAYDSNSNCLFMSDGFGRVSKLDIKKNLQNVGHCKGSAGSIRSIALHPSLPLIATAGLDRHVRIYDTKNCEIKKKIYAKQRLNTLLWSSEWSEESDDADEDVWDAFDPKKVKLEEADPAEDYVEDITGMSSGEEDNNDEASETVISAENDSDSNVSDSNDSENDEDSSEVEQEVLKKRKVSKKPQKQIPLKNNKKIKAARR